MKIAIVLALLIMCFISAIFLDVVADERMGNECYEVPFGEACVIRIDGTPYIFFSRGGVVRHKALIGQ